MTKSAYITQFDVITSRLLHSERMNKSFYLFTQQVLIAYRMPKLGYKQHLMNKNVCFINNKHYKDYLCLN